MRLYTLGSRGSRELKTFLEIRLISSWIDQKLKNKGRIHGFLKGKLGLILRPFDAIVEAVLRGRGSDSLGRCHGSRICGKFVSIFASKGPRSGHDRAAIGPQSCIDRDPGHQLIKWGYCRSNFALKEPWSRLDRTTIAVRSRHDRGVLPRVFSVIRWRSCDRDISTCVATITNDLGHPMKIVRSRAFNGEKKIGPSDLNPRPMNAWSNCDADQTLLTMPRVAHRASHLNII